MNYLKISIISVVITSLFTTQTQAQVSTNIDSVRKALSISQQNYKANPLNSKPISCVFATNAFRENTEFKHTQSSEPSSTNTPISQNGKSPLKQFRTDNLINQNEIYYIFSPKSEATILERTVSAILLFGTVW